MKVWMAVSFLALATGVLADTQETPHLQFVKEYIRELGELEALRVSSRSEQKLKDSNATSLTNSIHWSARTQIVLRQNIAMMKGMHLSTPYNELTGQISDIDRQKIALHDELIAGATEFMSGPKPGVDYGKIAANIPQVQAQLEALDKIFVEMSGLVFASLIDEKPDKDGHMSRLIITSGERQELLDQIMTAFGPSLDAKNTDDLMNSAWVLRS